VTTSMYSLTFRIRVMLPQQHNLPNSAQLWGIPYHSPKLHPGSCNSVGMRLRTDRQTDTETRVTTIHFASSTTHAKCNNIIAIITTIDNVYGAIIMTKTTVRVHQFI